MVVYSWYCWKDFSWGICGTLINLRLFYYLYYPLPLGEHFHILWHNFNYFTINCNFVDIEKMLPQNSKWVSGYLDWEKLMTDLYKLPKHLKTTCLWHTISHHIDFKRSVPLRGHLNILWQHFSHLTKNCYFPRIWYLIIQLMLKTLIWLKTLIFWNQSIILIFWVYEFCFNAYIFCL